MRIKLITRTAVFVLLLPILMSAQTPLESMNLPNGDRIVALKLFLRAIYPEIAPGTFDLTIVDDNFNVEAPENASWNKHLYFRIEPCRLSGMPPPGEVSRGYLCGVDKPNDPVYLGGGFKASLSNHSKINFFSAGGTFVTGKLDRFIEKLPPTAPKYEIFRLLSLTDARFDKAHRQEFIDQLPLAAIGRELGGKLETEHVELVVDSSHPSHLKISWNVTAKLKRNNGTQTSCEMQFDPFEGKLMFLFLDQKSQ